MPIIRALAADVMLVDEGDLEQALLLLLEVEKTVVEGAGAAPLAAVLRHREPFRRQAGGAGAVGRATSIRCCWRR